MAKRLRIRRGNFADLPTLSAGEFGFAEDTANLYIGQTSGTNKLLATLDISSLSEIDAIASGDKIPVYDVSTSTNKYVEAGDLISDNGEKKYYAKFEITPGETPTITPTVIKNTLGITPTVTISSTTVRITATALITTKTYPENSILVDFENSYYYFVVPGVLTPNSVVLTFYRTTNETSIDFTALTEPIEFYFGFTIFP